MKQQREHIAIVGAGLVGSLLSLMLAKRGYRVSLFEKRPDLRKTDISAGRSINLALAERGIAPLTAAGVMEDVEKLLVPMRGRMLHSIDGQVEFSSYGQRPHEVIHSVSRGGLNELLLDAAEQTGLVELSFQNSFADIDFGTNTLLLNDGSSGKTRRHSFDVLIGADGAGSAVRKKVIDANGGTCDVQFLDHSYKELTIPAGPGGQHQIEKKALHIWPRGGYMLIALPNLDGSFTVTLFLNSESKPGAEQQVSFAALDREERVVPFFAAQFPDALALMPNVASQFAANPTGPLGTVRCDRWQAGGQALLVGDASHAIVPFHGQGMNAGFEDCCELLNSLDRAAGDWPVAMEEFASRRPADGNAIADMALENYIIMRDSVRDPRFQLKKELGFELERQFPDRFIPRYSMVMFHRIPYAKVLRRGEQQNELLDELTRNATSLAEVDMDRAQALVSQLSSLTS